MKAWQLIKDSCGEGLKVGKASISSKHSNFLINEGGATSSEIEELGEKIRQRVWNKFGIKLNWEIKIVGKKSR